MKIFDFKKKCREEARTMSDIYVDLFAECDKLIDVSLKASGTTLEEMLTGLDEESGAVLGASMESLKKLTDLCSEQAALIDRMERKLDLVNERLIEQDRKLQMLVHKA